MLIKGPIVYAFLLPGIGIFEWWRSRQERLDTARRLQIGWSGPPQDGFAVANWWPWIASLAVFLLWVIGGILFAPGFFDQVVMREFVARCGDRTPQRGVPTWLSRWLSQSFSPAATQFSKSSLATAIITMRSLSLEGMFAMKRKRIIGVTKWCPRKMKGCSSICGKRISSNQIARSLNGTVAISMRSLRQRTRRQLCSASSETLLFRV